MMGSLYGDVVLSSLDVASLVCMCSRYKAMYSLRLVSVYEYEPFRSGEDLSMLGGRCLFLRSLRNIVCKAREVVSSFLLTDQWYTHAQQ